MSLNVGHTIQKFFNNASVGVAVNDETTTLLHKSGSVSQAGLINSSVQSCFKDAGLNDNLVGKIVDAKATKDRVYLLNDTGSVFEYNYNSGHCNGVREIYSPESCDGDVASKIVTGDAHVVILTKKGDVYGAGDNTHYQYLPQGSPRYETAQRIVVKDKIEVNNFSSSNSSVSPFFGRYVEAKSVEAPACTQVMCFSGSFTQVSNITVAGNYVSNIIPSASQSAIVTAVTTVTVPVFAVGCIYGNSFNGVANVGNYTISSSNVTGTYLSPNLPNFTTDVASIYPSAPLNTAPLVAVNGLPVTISGDVACINVSSILSALGLSGIFATDGQAGDYFDVTFHSDTINTSNWIHGGSGFADTVTLVSSPYDFTLCGTVCNGSKQECDEIVNQPCWAQIYAGGNNSILVDDCNRIYVFGDLNTVRNNGDLVRKSCLEDLLNNTQSTISFPADQLNCSNSPRDGCTPGKNSFKTDLSKFGIQVSFIPSVSAELVNNGLNSDVSYLTPTYNGNVCDFLSKLRECNENPQCEATCEPCDNNIYINVGTDDCTCSNDSSTAKYAYRFHNRKSVCRTLALGRQDVQKVTVSCLTDLFFEVNLNEWCVDGSDYPLCKTLIVAECGHVDSDCSIIDIYLDIDKAPLGVVFTTTDPTKVAEVNFNPNLICNSITDSCSSPSGVASKKFIINYGDAFDSGELANLSLAFKVPVAGCDVNARPQIVSTYVKGGDHISIETTGCKTYNGHMATYDVPTVFNFRRRIVDCAVAGNSVSVLTGNLNCPNEVYALGVNCHGQLGINSFANTLVWQKVNRCIVDSPISRLFAYKTATFYVTRSGSVLASGKWHSLVNSYYPTKVKLCGGWKVKKIAAAANHIVFQTIDDCIHGYGSNELGQLGLYRSSLNCEHVQLGCRRVSSVHCDEEESHHSKPINRRAEYSFDASCCQKVAPRKRYDANSRLYK